MKNSINDSVSDAMNDNTKNVSDSKVGGLKKMNGVNSSKNGSSSANGINSASKTKKSAFLNLSESVRAKKIQMFFMKSKVSLGDSIPPHEIRKIRKDIARELSGVDAGSIESKSIAKSASKSAAKSIEKESAASAEGAKSKFKADSKSKSVSDYKSEVAKSEKSEKSTSSEGKSKAKSKV